MEVCTFFCTKADISKCLQKVFNFLMEIFLSIAVRITCQISGNVLYYSEERNSVAENTFHTIRPEVDMPVSYENRKE